MLLKSRQFSCRWIISVDELENESCDLSLKILILPENFPSSMTHNVAMSVHVVWFFLAQAVASLAHVGSSRKTWREKKRLFLHMSRHCHSVLIKLKVCFQYCNKHHGGRSCVREGRTSSSLPVFSLFFFLFLTLLEFFGLQILNFSSLSCCVRHLLLRPSNRECVC